MQKNPLAGMRQTLLQWLELEMSDEASNKTTTDAEATGLQSGELGSGVHAGGTRDPDDV